MASTARNERRRRFPSWSRGFRTFACGKPFLQPSWGARSSARGKRAVMHGRESSDLIHVNVASPAGGYTVGNASFFRYVVRRAELGLPLTGSDREVVAMLAAIPHAFEADSDVPLVSGRGWRIVPAQGDMDWTVQEATPQQLRAAVSRARSLLWNHGARFRVSANEIADIEAELDAIDGVLIRAEAAGFAVNISYVA